LDFKKTLPTIVATLDAGHHLTSADIATKQHYIGDSPILEAIRVRRQPFPLKQKYSGFPHYCQVVNFRERYAGESILVAVREYCKRKNIR